MTKLMNGTCKVIFRMSSNTIKNVAEVKNDMEEVKMPGYKVIISNL